MSNTRTPPAKARVAFISGHVDITQQQFDQHYRAHLDAAIAAGDDFIVSSSRGADTLALEYLLTANVPKERITVYFNTPLPPKDPPKGKAKAKANRSKNKDAAPSSHQTNRRDPTPAAIQHYEDLGVPIRLISGDHTKRDVLMTRESDYDILWVRGEEETKALYGSKWRPGRVSGTERNRLRRDVIMVGREAMGRRGIGEVVDEGEDGGDRDGL